MNSFAIFQKDLENFSNAVVSPISLLVTEKSKVDCSHFPDIEKAINLKHEKKRAKLAGNTNSRVKLYKTYWKPLLENFVETGRLAVTSMSYLFIKKMSDVYKECTNIDKTDLEALETNEKEWKNNDIDNFSQSFKEIGDMLMRYIDEPDLSISQIAETSCPEGNIRDYFLSMCMAKKKTQKKMIVEDMETDEENEDRPAPKEMLRNRGLRVRTKKPIARVKHRMKFNKAVHRHINATGRPIFDRGHYKGESSGISRGIIRSTKL